ncbi:hypothetical protein P879_04071 [Paragonimus westermani]|uniref:Uncharacterized protein n=1 Tax=Paragonimus westermani TaxID=34504 RepID=A0A8T0DFB4_9TREM|nr:hypothetical protein P879_04071 [Paragonimus westermani]
MELEKPFVGVLYKKRWAILFIFSLCSMSNSYHWIHLNIISDRVLYIWNASIPGTTALAHQMAVDWLSMVYLLAYIPLIVPATWLLERFGLRATTLLAVLLNVLGAWLKCVAGVLAVDPLSPKPMNPSKAAAFPLLMFAQTLDAIAQVYILGVPAQLAATWFGEKEISTATSIGVLANQVRFWRSKFHLFFHMFCLRFKRNTE